MGPCFFLYRNATVRALLVVVTAITVAALSAQPFAGGWNDGSRLATVECLVDYHTLAIDRSIFVQVPPLSPTSPPLPYPEDDPGLLENGTGDKLLIDGHFYSDKSPVPALLMAGVYQVLQWSTGLRAQEKPAAFCYWMTVCSSGLAFVLAVWCIHQLAKSVRLSPFLQLALTGSFAYCTVALTYSRHVNNHILLLGIAAALMLELARLAQSSPTVPLPVGGLLWLGTLVGLGYTTDLGAGPVLLLCTVVLVAYRCRRLRVCEKMGTGTGPTSTVSRFWQGRPEPVPIFSQTLSALAVFGVGALPWLLLHHGVNYAVGGTLKPANAVAEYFDWPGCSFNAQNMTGSWNHPDLGHFLLYTASLLVGKRGFLGHNLPLFLAVPALVFLLSRKSDERPELLFVAGWCGGTWLIYAFTSNNSSGVCCSIRWFVPLLAPGYYVLALFLRRYPDYQWSFWILSGWGAVLGSIMWVEGPWMKHMVPFFWPIQGAALLTLVGYACRHWRRREQSSMPWRALTDEHARAA